MNLRGRDCKSRFDRGICNDIGLLAAAWERAALSFLAMTVGYAEQGREGLFGGFINRYA